MRPFKWFKIYASQEFKHGLIYLWSFSHALQIHYDVDLSAQ